MAYIPGEHYVLCAGCIKKLYRSEAVRGDYNKLLYCRECVDYKWPKAPTLPRDPRPIDARYINIEGPDVFITVNPHRLWEDITDTWDTLFSNWEDV